MLAVRLVLNTRNLPDNDDEIIERIYGAFGCSAFTTGVIDHAEDDCPIRAFSCSGVKDMDAADRYFGDFSAEDIDTLRDLLLGYMGATENVLYHNMTKAEYDDRLVTIARLINTLDAL